MTTESALPVELSWVAVAMTGTDAAPSLERAPRASGFAGLKGVVDGLLSGDVDAPKWRFYNGLQLVPNGALEVRQGERSLGFAWEVSRPVLDAWELSRPVYVAQLRLDLLGRADDRPAQFREPSRYPSVRRDLALVVPEGTRDADLRSWVTTPAGPYLASIELFDEYRGKHIPAGRVGLGYSLMFRAMDRTLEDKEVDAAIDRVVSALAERGITRREA